ncbi:hypothetical protein ACFQ0B_52160 [Nonomuraea thailandensis]
MQQAQPRPIAAAATAGSAAQRGSTADTPGTAAVTSHSPPASLP